MRCHAGADGTGKPYLGDMTTARAGAHEQERAKHAGARAHKTIRECIHSSNPKPARSLHAALGWQMGLGMVMVQTLPPLTLRVRGWARVLGQGLGLGLGLGRGRVLVQSQVLQRRPGGQR